MTSPDTPSDPPAPLPDQPPRSETDEGRLIGLELLRFASALSILVWHYQHFAYVGTTESVSYLSAAPFYRPLRLIHEWGYFSVHYFWCISGFIFFWKYGRPISERKVGGWKFFVLRFSRLYPLHLLTLLLTAALQGVHHSSSGTFFVYEKNDLPHFALQLFLASDWLSSLHSFNGPIWSISIEVLVYAFFFIALTLSRRPLALCLLVSGVALVIIQRKLSTHAFVVCLLMFHMGGLMAELGRRFAGKRGSAWLGLAAGVAIGLTLALESSTRDLLRERIFRCVLVTAPCLTYLCALHLRLSGWLKRIAVAAGNLTYSSYLLHFPLQLALVTGCALTGAALPYPQPGFFILYLGLTLGLAAWCYRSIEMPLQATLRRRML